MEPSSETLSTGVAAAWGVRAPSTRGPKRGLSLEAIVAAGVAVADAEGLAAVSMSRVAKELGTAAMSLYRYVDSKDDLLTLMLDAAWGGPPAPAPELDWRAGLTRWAQGTVGAMRAHPWTVRIPVSGPPLGPNAVAWFEDALAAMRDTGLTEAEKASIVMMLGGYVTNHVLVMGDVQAHFLQAAPTPDAAMLDHGATLRRLTRPDRYPALHALLDAGVFDRADPPDEEFAFGLERILDGVEALVQSRARSR
jgi:AcrR family transcriptional regulator